MMNNIDFGGVELATKNDEDQIFDLLLAMHTESPVHSFDVEVVRDNIQKGTDKKGGIIGVIRGPQRLEATCGLLLSEAAWYTRDLALNSIWTFVHPDHRRSTHARKLIEFGKICSRWFAQAGTPVPLQTAVYSDERTEAKCRLHRRQLHPIGQLFVYRPEAIQGS